MDEENLEEMYVFYSKLRNDIINNIKKTINLKKIKKETIPKYTIGHGEEITFYITKDFIIRKKENEDNDIKYQIRTDVPQAELLIEKDVEAIFNFVDLYYMEYKQWI